MLTYQVASRKATLGKNKGKTIYYAKADEVKTLSREGLEDHIVSKTMMSRGDVRQALTTFAETVQWALSEGLSVDLGDLGSFKVVAYSKQESKAEDVSVQSLKPARVRFYPRRKMVDAARDVSLSVRSKSSVSSGSSTRRRKPKVTKPVAPAPTLPPGGVAVGGSASTSGDHEL